MISSWVKILPHGAGLPLPKYGTPMAAGMDFLAAVEKNLILKPGETTLVPTGLAVAFPEGFELQIRPRSGLALNHGITIPNAPGTIDADYRGEIKILLHNGGKTPFTIRRGDRIAQGVLARYEKIVWKETDHLPETSRGHGGFGSTGI